jgi:UDP-N-acetylmuramoyl-L-alanyl-D-glutamate--2,6-diaminopimelate ligase
MNIQSCIEEAPVLKFPKSVTPSSTIARHPSEDLYVIGITGTNGKTTVAYLVGEVLKAAGYKPFILGTFNSGNINLSTPESADILTFMNNHLEQGGTHFIMEVTSEGIDQNRVLDVDFDVKLLTNITQDHLDYHKTMEHYTNTKMNFMRKGNAHKILPTEFFETVIDFPTQLLGEFNLLNIRAAASILRHMGIDETHITNALSSCIAPRGRLESVNEGQAFMILIDYAHTPDAVKNVLNTVKKIAKDRQGRLLVLFGCGGNRDSSKRAKMGRIASQIADQMIITDDNPRLEESHDIINEIVSGIESDFTNYTSIPDRKEAIECIVKQSSEKDVVILLGKGHETYQIIKAETLYFDDREEAINAIESLNPPLLLQN